MLQFDQAATASPKRISSINTDNTFVLSGDIGGTKTSLGLFIKGKRRPLLKVLETYHSSEATGLEKIIERFLEKNQAPITSVCFGIAGPVINGRCKTTNLPWDVSENRIKKYLNVSHVRLINDLEATALGAPLLSRHELFPLNGIKTQKGGSFAIVAPGTGLGEALLVYREGRYIVIPSEGGHADFSPNHESEVGLWQYLHRRYGHVSIERVLSGPGLFNIYSWFKHSGRYKEPGWLSNKINRNDPAKTIAEAAMNKKQPLCVATLNMFVSILGSVAGNLALTGMATGGVYLGGGIPPKILPKLQEDIFMKAFIDKGRFSKLMEKIPVKVIVNDTTALLGAASHAFLME